MLPDDSAKLLAACEKKVLTSDYEDQKAEKKPASRKRRPKKSGFLNYRSKLDNASESNGSRIHKHFNRKPARSTSSNATSHRLTNAGFRDELQSATRSELLRELHCTQSELQSTEAVL